MSKSELPAQKKTAASNCQPTERLSTRHVVACVNGALFEQTVLIHAASMAKAIGARLTIINVLRSSTTQEPMDPVDWTQRHCATNIYLHQRIAQFSDLQAEVVVLHGSPAERICAWVRDNGVDVVVLGRGHEVDRPFGGMGGTARRIVEAINASALLVPPMPATHQPVSYRKLLVPLDGSARAECALPLGLEIAAAHGAEVVLVHAAPKFDLIEGDLLSAEAIALRDQLYQHNERAARDYLDWLQARLPVPLVTNTRLLPSGDARRALVQMATQEHADLMVLSAAGKSGHADMAVGRVADYLINRISIPVLLVRQHQPHPAKPHGEVCNAMDIRQPNQRMV